MKMSRVEIIAMAPIVMAAGTIAQAAPPAAPPIGAGQRSAAAAAPAPVPRAAFLVTMEGEFRKMDADRNGILSRREIEGFQKAMAGLAAQRRNIALFQSLDQDRNGQLSPTEFSGLPMSVPQIDAAQELAQVDGNRDGQVTLIEYRAGKLVNFDRMDVDKDGVVGPAELRAAGVIK